MNINCVIEHIDKSNVADGINKLPPDSDDIAYKYGMEFGKYAFELEEKREESLLAQAGRVLTAVSVFSAFSMTILSLILERIQEPKAITVDMLIGNLSLFAVPLVLSLVFSVLAQWRYGYQAMDSAKVFLNSFLEDKEHYYKDSQFYYQWVEQIEKMHKSKELVNKRRATLTIISMILFIVSVIMVLIVVGRIVLIAGGI